jgi:BlaI family transcriptional regulator, penicillinase repressor
MRKRKTVPIPEVSPAEWRILELLWSSAPQSAAAMRDQLDGVTGWALATVNTLLRRLEDKGAVAAERSGREFLYRPVVARQDCALRESRTLIDRVFGGRLAPLVAAFAESGRLTTDELAELQTVLRRAQEKTSDSQDEA